MAEPKTKDYVLNKIDYNRQKLEYLKTVAKSFNETEAVNEKFEKVLHAIDDLMDEVKECEDG